jgi:hypothetical protein
MRYVWQSFLKFLHSPVQAIEEFRLKRLLKKSQEQIDLGIYKAALKSIKNAQQLNPSHPGFSTL